MSPAPTSSDAPAHPERRPVQYRGADLEPARGPGLGCFYSQLVVLIVLVMVTPLSVVAGLPPIVSGVLLFATIGLLLVAGQTTIFLLRLVAAERREGRRRPMAAAAARTPTVGELEDQAAAPALAVDPGEDPAPDIDRDRPSDDDLGAPPPMRQ